MKTELEIWLAECTQGPALKLHSVDHSTMMALERNFNQKSFTIIWMHKTITYFTWRHIWWRHRRKIFNFCESAFFRMNMDNFIRCGISQILKTCSLRNFTLFNIDFVRKFQIQRRFTVLSCTYHRKRSWIYRFHSIFG